MIRHISKEDAQKLYNSASTHVPAGAKAIQNIVNNTKPQQHEKPDFTKNIIASLKGKGSK